MNAILIDTNIYSHAMRGDTEIIKVLQQVAHRHYGNFNWRTAFWF